MKFNKKILIVIIVSIIILVSICFIFLRKNKNNIFEISQFKTIAKPNKVVENKETIPFLPEGATVINEDLNSGIVIKDKNNNEWVWIEVPKSLTENANTEGEIEEALKKYVSVDSTGNNALITHEEGYTENYHEGIGLSEKQYNSIKREILKNIKANGGFYVGRYETGYNISEKDSVRLRSGETTQVPVIQQNAYPYNFVTNEQAEKLSESLSTEDSKCSLMLGIQYDLIFKYLNVKGKITPETIINDSTKIGNYSNNHNLKITSKNAKKLEFSKIKWESAQVGKIKIKEDKPVLLTTGASDDTKILNIYDIAGNVFEWSLEKGFDDKYPCAYLGGNYRDRGIDLPCSKRFENSKNDSFDYIGFRATMY